MTIISRLIIIGFVVNSCRALLDYESQVARQIESTDVVRSPENFTMNYTNFQMSVRPKF